MDREIQTAPQDANKEREFFDRFAEKGEYDVFTDAGYERLLNRLVTLAGPQRLARASVRYHPSEAWVLRSTLSRVAASSGVSARISAAISALSRRNGITWDSILSCDILGIYKPDPRCYARAAEIVDCAPHDIVMVASHPSDLRAAMACGYRSAYVVPRLEDPGDDYVDTGFAQEFHHVARDFADLATRLV